MKSLGVIFDADGVLFDSERQSFEALRLALLAVTDGRVHPDENDFGLYCGRDDDSIVSELNTVHGFSIDPAQFREIKLQCYADVIAADPVVVADGVCALLDRLDVAGVRYAVATSAIRAKLEMSLLAVGLQDRFRIVTTADDIAAGKPDPAIFTVTAERLGLPARRLVVFEDTVNGIAAANRAGMFSVGVVGIFRREELSQACRVLDSFSQVNVLLLDEWIEAWNKNSPGG